MPIEHRLCENYYPDLMKKLEDLSGLRAMMLKCKLPTFDLDVLVSVTCDEDLQNVMEEYTRYDSCRLPRRVRAFLFPLKPCPAEFQRRYSNPLAQKEIFFVKKGNGYIDYVKRSFTRTAQ